MTLSLASPDLDFSGASLMGLLGELSSAAWVVAADMTTKLNPKVQTMVAKLIEGK